MSHKKKLTCNVLKRRDKNTQREMNLLKYLKRSVVFTCTWLILLDHSLEKIN